MKDDQPSGEFPESLRATSNERPAMELVERQPLVALARVWDAWAASELRASEALGIGTSAGSAMRHGALCYKDAAAQLMKVLDAATPRP